MGRNERGHWGLLSLHGASGVGSAAGVELEHVQSRTYAWIGPVASLPVVIEAALRQAC